MKTIKLLWLYVLFSFVIFMLGALAETKDRMEMDGTDWINSSDSNKKGYVTGFISGLNVAREKIYTSRIDLKDEFNKERFDSHWKDIILNQFAVGQINKGMNAFYKNLNNSKIKMVDAIYVVKMQIEGKNPELIDAQIRYLRIQPIDTRIIAECYKKLEAFHKEKGRDPTYKEIKNGDFSFEDLLKCKLFIDENNNLHLLFRYGRY